MGARPRARLAEASSNTAPSRTTWVEGPTAQPLLAKLEVEVEKIPSYKSL